MDSSLSQNYMYYVGINFIYLIKKNLHLTRGSFKVQIFYGTLFELCLRLYFSFKYTFRALKVDWVVLVQNERYWDDGARNILKKIGQIETDSPWKKSGISFKANSTSCIIKYEIEQQHDFQYRSASSPAPAPAGRNELSDYLKAQLHLLWL